MDMGPIDKEMRGAMVEHGSSGTIGVKQRSLGWATTSQEDFHKPRRHKPGVSCKPQELTIDSKAKFLETTSSGWAGSLCTQRPRSVTSLWPYVGHRVWLSHGKAHIPSRRQSRAVTDRESVEPEPQIGPRPTPHRRHIEPSRPQIPR